MIKKFLFYGFCGICMEVLWTGLGALYNGDLKLSAFTYVWMIPIYGFAMFLEVVHNSIKNMPFFIRGGVYAILILTVEYFSGMLLKILIGDCPWNYSNSVFSVNGLIRLDYFPVWFVVGLAFERIHHLLEKKKILVND